MKQLNNKPKVFVAMSGGVDSSVAAYLLEKHGFDVIGVFMKNWTKELPNSSGCASEYDYEDARRVAAKLKIPLYTFNFEKEYKKKVVDYMIKSYKKGLTPNPDVMCNKEIKFKLFLEKALKSGADYVATGHYVKIQNSKIKNQNDNSKSKIIYKLFKAKDKNKDQSYFLWTLGQSQLRYCIFPIGNYLKSQVRKIAEKAGLHNFNKKDSQGLCFLGKFDFQKFLRQIIKPKNGKLIDENGNVIGKHDGATYFTIGQRHGLNIGGTGPYFVYKIDIKKNIVYICKGEDNKLLFSKELIASDINWISGAEPEFPFTCKAKIRYRTKAADCRVQKYKNGLKVVFNKSQRAITPGQSVVFYKNNEMLGGGIIKYKEI